MLTFKKSYEQGGATSVSSFSVVTDMLVVTRVVDNRVHRIMVKCDSISTLSTHVNRLTKLPNDEFKLYSEIQFDDTNKEVQDDL